MLSIDDHWLTMAKVITQFHQKNCHGLKGSMLDACKANYCDSIPLLLRSWSHQCNLILCWVAAPCSTPSHSISWHWHSIFLTFLHDRGGHKLDNPIHFKLGLSSVSHFINKMSQHFCRGSPFYKERFQSRLRTFEGTRLQLAKYKNVSLWQWNFRPCL